MFRNKADLQPVHPTPNAKSQTLLDEIPVAGIEPTFLPEYPYRNDIGEKADGGVLTIRPHRPL